MALTYDEANSVSSAYFDKGITSQVYEKSPFVWKLKSKNKVTADGGTQIDFAIRYTTLGLADAVDPRSQIGYEQKETRTKGVLDWKYYVAKTMIQWDERVQNSGKAQIVNLIRDKSEELNQDMFNKFITDVYATSQGTNNIVPLAVIVDSSDSYAGISVSDASEWASVEDGTTTRLTLYGSGSLSYQLNQCAFGNDGVDYILTTRDLMSKVESLLQPQERFQPKDMADAGFTSVQFHGIPVAADYACPTGYMYGLDTNYWELRYHPDFNFKVSPWQKLEQAGFPEAMIKLVMWTGNLCCKMRKVNFKMSALDYTL